MATISNTPRPGYVWDSTDNVWYPIGVGNHNHSEIAKTIVDAKGDLIVGTAADTVARQAVGTDGQMLVADSTQTNGIGWADQPVVAGKNFVINGGMDIWQRGTSFNNPASAYYTADRFQGMRHSQVTGITVSRQATGDTTNLAFLQYCARISRDSGNTSTNSLYFGSVIETINSIPLAGKTVTLSFYARKGANYSPASNGLNVKLISGTGTDQNNTFTSAFTGATDVISQTATLTSTWQRFSYSATIGATATELQTLVYATPVGTAGAADYFEVTGVQLELGSYATTFSRAGGSIGGELALCQRYYWRFTGPGAYSAYGFGAYGGTTTGYILMDNPVTFRTTPTSLDYANLAVQLTDGGGPVAVTNLAIDQNSLKNTTLLFTVGTAGTAFRPCRLLNNNNTAGYVGLNAEL